MSQSSPPAAPNPAKTYAQGIQTYLQYLPQLLSAEQNAELEYDPQKIQEQQDLQAQFGPAQYAQQLAALNQIDPAGQTVRAQLGGSVSSDLAQGYNLGPQLSQQVTNQIRAAEAARGNTQGNAAISAEGLYAGQAAQALYQQRLNNAGQFLNTATPEQQILDIQGVQPNTSSPYVNQNAGYQGQQFGLSNFQNLIAQQQLSASANPWTQIASGAASGLASGAASSAATAWSDIRLKTGIKLVGLSPRGHKIFEFSYKWKPKRRYRGVIAQLVEQITPQAVFMASDGYLAVRYYLLDVPFEEVK